MRHSFLIQILILTCLSLTLAACQSPTPPTPEQDSTQANKVPRIVPIAQCGDFGLFHGFIALFSKDADAKRQHTK